MLPMRTISPDQSIDQMRSLFIEEGYLLVKNLFTSTEIAHLRSLVQETLKEQKWAKLVSENYIACEPVHRIGSPSFFSCIEELMKKEDLHLIAYHKKLVDLLNGLLKCSVFPHPRKMVRLSYPYEMNPKDLTPAHQDIFYVRGEPDTLTVWIPLGNYSFDQGGLQVASSSHLKGLYPCKANDEGRFNCTASEIGLEKLDWRCADYEMGDVLIMHSLTLHQAIKNNSENFRISLDCRFSAADGYINEEQLLPPYHPHIADWSVLNKNWKNPNLFETPSALKIDSADYSLEKVLKRPSLIPQMSEV